LTIPASDLAIGVAPDLVLADMAGNDLYAAALGARGNAVSRFVFSPAQDGSYALRPAGVASYTLQVDAVAADDVADLAALARPLDVAATYQALGMVVQGGDGPELFIGGSRDDQFYGDGGADILSGGPGNDLLDGGAGIDLARYPGTRLDYQLSHGAGSWAVQDLRGALGTDTLVGVERLASRVRPRRWRSIWTDRPAWWPAHRRPVRTGLVGARRRVGVGLAALPTMSPLELAQVAVTSDLFAPEVGSHSNRDFVFAVYTHVFGRPPANADLQAYTALLDRGEYTQATLALAAADAPQNLVNIVFVGLQAGGIDYLPG
jgi:Ca2+-binding RTX toxin-like protein